MEPEKQFRFRDETSIASLDALKEKIETISYNEFYHHVNSSRNDFANWIRYVLKDENLADQLDKTTSIVETVEVINDYLHPSVHTREDDLQAKIEEKLGIEFENKKEEELGELPEIPETNSEETPTFFGEREEEAHEPTTIDSQDEEVEQPTIIEEEQTQEESTTQEPYSHHYKHSEREKNELKEFHHNLDKIIVKDFIWGMLFGLILGFILARMLSL